MKKLILKIMNNFNNYRLLKFMNKLKKRIKQTKDMSLEKTEEVVIFEAYLAGSANIFKNLIELLSQVLQLKK